MDVVRVVVENWPQSTSLLDYVPVAIAVVALVVSLYSVYLTRQSFVASHRPYVWALSHAVLDSDGCTLTPVPQYLAFRVQNAPALVKIWTVEISVGTESLLIFSEADTVRFPDDRSQWVFSVGQQDFEALMSRSDEEKGRLRRIVSMKYSSLSGGKAYQYDLEQVYVPADNQWIDVAVKAN